MCDFKHGDVVWVNSDVLGWPPTRHIVDYVMDNKLIYRDSESESESKYKGCRVGSAHKSLKEALEHALQHHCK